MKNEPVAWYDNEEPNGIVWKENIELDNGTPLYTHPHPDNFGLALSIIDQQKLEIERLKAKLAQADRVYDFDNPLLNSDDVGFRQIELNAELLRKAQEK